MVGERLAKDKKNAKDQGQTLVFVDESGFYLLPLVVRTYAPRGVTPRLHNYLSHDHLSVISGITETGRLLVQSHGQNVSSSEVIGFLRYLLTRVSGEVCVLWDRAPIHRSAEIKTFLGTPVAKRLHLEYLPAYAPELNPDEGVWSLLKRRLANVCCPCLDVLVYKLRQIVRQLRRHKATLRGCLRETALY